MRSSSNPSGKPGRPIRPIPLAADQRRTLERLRDTALKPYLRERAAAILKVVDGRAAKHVAQWGLLRPRRPATVYKWLNRFREEGIPGLSIRPGRGRKPAFSP